LIESLLFPHYDTSRKQELLDLLNRMHGVAGQYRRRFDHIGLLRGQVIDAAKLEVFRVLTLGIAGFDTPLTPNSIVESAAALEGVSEALVSYKGVDSLSADFVAAQAYLSAHPDFNDFDRAFFITRYGNRLSRGITALATRLGGPVIRYNRLLRQDAATLFDPGVFDPDAYLPENGAATTPSLVEMGRQLFNDPKLSGPGTRSCASCHRPELAFTDGMTRNTVLGSHALLPRNTPTLFNAALQPAQFDDLRAATLEDQIRDVLSNPAEMRGSLSGPDSPVIVSALAAYVRSLVRLDSRFDAFMRGDGTALSADEVRGFNLFMGKARCGTCHYMPLFNGSFPPLYSRTEAEVIGVPGMPGSGVIDTDEGQYAILHAPFLHHAFKTPTLRNVARTAPYMHNGVFTTLEQVVDFYNDGGGVGEGERIYNQTLPVDSLRLSVGEKSALVAFLRSLDSRQ
jgi:cytochrome c peroxidase